MSRQGTSILVKASRDTGPTRHGVRFDIPGPSTPSVAPVPLSSPGMPMATAPCLSFQGCADSHAYDEGRHQVVRGREGWSYAVKTIAHALGRRGYQV